MTIQIDRNQHPASETPRSASRTVFPVSPAGADQRAWERMGAIATGD